MKLIESNVEYIPQAEGLEGIYKMIELAGRTAYKSEDKITEGSAKKFVDMLIRNKHYAALEHGAVYLAIPITTYYSRNSIIYFDSPYCKVKESRELMFKDKFGDAVDCWCITTNLRFIQENDLWQGIKELSCSPSIFHEKRYTFKFTCDRGISHELVRHRAFSFLQESTRYCNYMMDKFGNEVTFIEPSSYCEMMTHAFKNAEDTYMMLIDAGWTPQQARAVLPNALKTELVMTGFANDWRYLLDLRYFEKTGPVHPDMKVLMQKLAALMHVTGVWDDVMKQPSKFD